MPTLFDLHMDAYWLSKDGHAADHIAAYYAEKVRTRAFYGLRIAPREKAAPLHNLNSTESRRLRDLADSYFTYEWVSPVSTRKLITFGYARQQPGGLIVVTDLGRALVNRNAAP